MTNKIKRFKKQLRHGISTFIYKKKSNGKVRKAHGTLDKKIIPKEDLKKPGEESTRHAPSDSVVYYDTDKGAIRSFKDYLLMRIYKEVLKKKEEKQPEDKKKDSGEKQPEDKS